MDTEILEIVQAYLTYTHEKVDEEVLYGLVNSIIGQYQQLRNYPEDCTEEIMEADTKRYFRRKKGEIAMQIIPAMIGKVGAEGLKTLIDNQVTRNWIVGPYLTDVVPYCSVH